MDLSGYAELLESLGDGIVVIDADSRIVFFNSEAERIFGYDRTEAIGRSVETLLPPDRKAAHERHVAQFATASTQRRQMYQRADIRGQRKDGSLFDAEVAISKIDIGGTQFFTAVVRDVGAEKRLERALRESERLLRRSQEVAGLGSWAWDRKTGKQVWSDEFYRLLGLSPGEVEPTFENYMVFTHPDDRAKYFGSDIEGWVDRVLAGQIYRDQEIRIVRPDGSVRWMRRWFGVDLDANGEIAGATGTLQDITEQREAAERLKLSEERLRRAQEMAQIGSWERGADKQHRWTDQLFRIYGLEPGSVAASYELFVSIVHPDDRPRLGQLLEEASSQRLKEQTHDLRIVRPDGVERIINQHVEYCWSAEGGLLSVAGTSQDVTEWREAVERLRDSERLLNRAQRVSRIGSWEVDLQANRVFWSDQLFEILGLRPHHPPTHDTFLTMVHPDDRGLNLREFNEAIAGRLASRSFDIRVIRADGALRIFQLLYEFDWDSGDYPSRLTGTAEDVTEERAAQTALRQAVAAAEEANLAKSAFLANMSHELRTPLNAIIGFSEFIGQMAGSRLGIEKIREYAGYIHSSGTHLLEIICEILDLSRIEAGRLALVEDTIDMRELVDWAANMIGPQAQTAGVRLRAEPGAQGQAIVADRRLMRESLLNLLSNAVKFTPVGGDVALTVSDAEDGGLVIAVSDSGIGMKSDDIPAALMPFTQLESTLTRRHPGTGLGLPLTKKFVELHGGRLEIESAPDRGTCVKLLIPAARRRSG